MLKQRQQSPQSLSFRFLPTCCWEHNPLKQWIWFISFYKITPATTAFISTPPLCLCHQEPESNNAWF